MVTTESPLKEQLQTLPENPPKTPETTLISAEIPKLKPSNDPITETATPINSQAPETSSSTTNFITIPSYSKWFSWDKIHETERRILPEFFDGKSPSKDSRVYMYYRNSIIRLFRKTPLRRITFTQVRKVIVGDVGSIRRVFDFLESWGLINYTGTTTSSSSSSKTQLKLDDKENKSSGEFGGNLYENSIPKKLCSGCKSVCSIACFVCDKFDLTLCARCYVRGNYRVGLSSPDFRRVEISEESKTVWTDKETLHLLEAVMHYGDDWKKVAEHVGGRSERECVARFIKLPFAQQFVGHPDSEELDFQTRTPHVAENGDDDFLPLSPAKRRCLTPFADTSNPIMAQVAFLSAMVGSGVAEAAAQAAVEALSDANVVTDGRCMQKNDNSLPDEKEQKESSTATNGGTNISSLEEAVTEARTLIQKEEQDMERSISGIIEVQMNELEDKIVHFEEAELQMEREWKQLQHMKNLLFTDQMALLFQGTTPSAMEESIHVAKTSEAVT